MSDDEKQLGVAPSNSTSSNSATIPSNQELPQTVDPPTASLVSLPQILTFQEEAAAKAMEEERLRNEVTQSEKAARKEIIKAYLNSLEFKQNNESKVRARVKTVLQGVSQAKANRATDLIEKFKSEGTWCTFAMEEGHQKRVAELADGQSACSDLIRKLKILGKRGVWLCDCPGSVAHMCIDEREERTLPNGTVLNAVTSGIRFRISALSEPPMYSTARNACTPGPQEIIYEYSDEMAEKIRGTDPLGFYDDIPLPTSFTQEEIDNHITRQYPNTFSPIFTEKNPVMQVGQPVLTPAGTIPMEPQGFDALARVRMEIFVNEHNLTRQALANSTNPEMQVRSHNDAQRVLANTLQRMKLEIICPQGGTKDKIRNNVITAIGNAEKRLIRHYKKLLYNILTFWLAEKGLYGIFWSKKILGRINPQAVELPEKDWNAPPEDTFWAHKPAFGFALEDQKDRHDMLKPATAYLRHQVVFSTMFIALANVLEAYDCINTILGIPFHQIVINNIPNGEIAPYFEPDAVGFFTISGCWGFLAYDAINPARREVMKCMQPVVDDYFKHVQTVDPVEDQLLKDLNICPTPSKDARKYILDALRHNNHQQGAHTHSRPSNQSTSTSTSSSSSRVQQQPPQPPLTADLPADMAAVLILEDHEEHPGIIQTSNVTNVTFSSSRNTAGVSQQYNTSNPFTPYTPTGSTMRMVCDAILYNPTLPNKNTSSFNANAYTIGGDPQHGCSSDQPTWQHKQLQQWWGVHNGDAGHAMGASTPVVQLPQPEGRDTTGGTTTELEGQRGQQPDILGVSLLRLCTVGGGEEAGKAEHSPQRFQLLPGATPQQPKEPTQQGTQVQNEALQQTETPLGGLVYGHPSPKPVRRRQRRPRGKRRRRTPLIHEGMSLPSDSDVPQSPYVCIDNDYDDDLTAFHASVENMVGLPTAFNNSNCLPTEGNDVNAINVTSNSIADNIEIVSQILAPPSNVQQAHPLTALTANVTNLGVNNISSYNPTVEEIRVLALGLNFIPEPDDITNVEIYQALDEFTDTILWKEQLDYIGSNNQANIDDSPIAQLRRKLRKKLHLKQQLSAEETKIKEKSYIKSFETNEYLQQIRTRFREDISNKRFKTHHRLSVQDSKEIDAILWNLRTNQLIVIKPADKNLGPTIMDKQWYIDAGELILKDESTYRAIDSFNITTIRNELIFLLATSNHIQLKNTSPTEFMYSPWKNEPMKVLAKQYIISTSDLADIFLEPFYNPDTIQPCRSYFLPKLQKLLFPYPRPPPLILGRTPPVRPICASIGWITYIVSIYLDIILKPIMIQLPSYIMNSAALAKELEIKPFPPTCALLAADVESLYPSIDINRGLDALDHTLKEKHFPTDTRQFIIRLARWVLFNNITEFNNKLYLQTRGTAMGTPCAVVVACIYMGTIERKAWASLTTLRHISPLLDYRFIDDLLIIAKSQEEAQVILDTFNSIDPLIKLTGTTSQTSANFLDLVIYKGSRFTTSQIFDLDVYQKPTNQFLFLPYDSYHPDHVFQGWIRGYLGRLRINCTDDIIYHVRRSQFWKQLLERGYAELDLSTYFQYDPLRSVLIAKIRTTPKGASEGSHKTFFKIRHSPRTTQLMPTIKHALSASPQMMVNPSLAKQLNKHRRPTIALFNSPKFGHKLISAKLTSSNPIDYRYTGAERHLYRKKREAPHINRA